MNELDNLSTKELAEIAADEKRDPALRERAKKLLFDKIRDQNPYLDSKPHPEPRARKTGLPSGDAETQKRETRRSEPILGDAESRIPPLPKREKIVSSQREQTLYGGTTSYQSEKQTHVKEQRRHNTDAPDSGVSKQAQPVSVAGGCLNQIWDTFLLLVTAIVAVIFIGFIIGFMASGE